MEKEFIVEEPQMQNQQDLPNATLILILGIVSIVGCCCYAIVGLIVSIITIVLANQSMKLYKANPGLYRQGSYNNVNVGRICAWVGLGCSIAFVCVMVATIAAIGWEALSDPDAMMRLLESY